MLKLTVEQRRARHREYCRRYRERNPHRVARSRRGRRARAAAARTAELSSLVYVPLTVRAAFAVVHLNRGLTAKIDVADFALVAGRRWFVAVMKGGRYAATSLSQRRDGRRGWLLMHRHIVGAPSRVNVDHENNDGLDNRRSNIRRCDQSLNNANQHKVRGKVPFKGVWRHPKTGAFHAQAKLHGKNHLLGEFATAEEAARAYDRKAVELFGPFARTNQSLGLLGKQGGSNVSAVA